MFPGLITSSLSRLRKNISLVAGNIFAGPLGSVHYIDGCYVKWSTLLVLVTWDSDDWLPIVCWLLTCLTSTVVA